LEKKRLELDKDLHEWVEQSKRELMLREAPLSWEVADELRFTILKQRDPADRFLVATAKVYDLTLVTADQHLVNVPGLNVLQNRC
jgi:PIN domain nuclease of toxin-antitoxin system